jgi:PPM family protein phosphatase
MSLSLRFAARSDVGLIREGNEDSGYAGPRLLAVADGMGGHAAGEVASSVAVATLSVLDEDVPGPDLLDALAVAIVTANDHLRDMVAADEDLEGMGTTLTALLWGGSRVGLAHIGDSRAYLLRDGQLQQITHDHTFVQRLVDEGRLSPEEAEHHPQRSILLRALDGRGDADPDLSIREVRPGDRYLLCSDGLSGVVSEDTIRETLAKGASDEAADQLVEFALRGGGPDNITCIVADVVDIEDQPSTVPVVVGAAGRGDRGRRSSHSSAAGRAAQLQPKPDRPDDADDDQQPSKRRWVLPAFLFLIFLGVVGGGGYLAYQWSQQQYYVAPAAGVVAIYKGVDQSLAGRDLSKVYESTDIQLHNLPAFQRERVEQTISAQSLDDAKMIVERLREQAKRCALPTATPAPSRPDAPAAPRTPAARPPATPTAKPTPAPTAKSTVRATPKPTPTRPAECEEVSPS